MNATLVLEDGRTFRGRAFGASGKAGGEVCFNTSMSGYQEVLTDPSYRGQMVCMTYPLIGNYGLNEADAESGGVHPRGFIVKAVSPVASNRLSECELGDYLSKHGVVGIEGIDTRALTRHLRDKGAMRGIIATGEVDEAALVTEAEALPSLGQQDLVGQVTAPEPHSWDESISEDWVGTDILPPEAKDSNAPKLHVVAYDFGIKHGILRGLVRTGCKVTVVPARFPAAEALALKPDGIFLSNGPGDPSILGDIVEQVKRLVEEKPVFGICLGNQILAQVFGAKTYKLKFGHRGANHPVKDLTTGKIEITTQNHGYAVDGESLDSGVEVSHVNLNDGTVEGLAHRELPVFSVQYHPEASPGPHDAYYLFGRFCERIEAARV